MPERALMIVHGDAGPPTLESAAAELGVSVADLDRDFGVVLVDPRRHLYSVQVDAERLPAAAKDDTFRGPFSNPRIDTFGPPQTGKRRKR